MLSTFSDIRPMFWPLSTHLEDVTSQVISFVSIYKTIMCESERASHWRDSCSRAECVSRSLDEERESVMNSHNPWRVIWQLEKCDLMSNIAVHHPIHAPVHAHTVHRGISLVV